MKKKKMLVLPVLAVILAFATAAIAQTEMYNAPASGQLPTLAGPQTSNFEAACLSDAQSVCDQVASDNNKTSCTAVKNEANPENVVTYHCDCR